MLEASRYLLVLPVLGSLLLMVTVVAMGVAMVVAQEWSLLRDGTISPASAKKLTIGVIETVDMFLVAAICYIMAVGIHALFISQEEGQILKRIKIERLADLESKIIGVVVVAIAVSFLGKTVEAIDAQSVMQGGVGAAVVIGALCLFIKFSLRDDE